MKGGGQLLWASGVCSFRHIIALLSLTSLNMGPMTDIMLRGQCSVTLATDINVPRPRQVILECSCTALPGPPWQLAVHCCGPITGPESQHRFSFNCFDQWGVMSSVNWPIKAADVVTDRSSANGNIKFLFGVTWTCTIPWIILFQATKVILLWLSDHVLCGLYRIVHPSRHYRWSLVWIQQASREREKYWHRLCFKCGICLCGMLSR